MKESWLASSIVNEYNQEKKWKEKAKRINEYKKVNRKETQNEKN